MAKINTDKFGSEGDPFTAPVCGKCKHDNGDGTCKAFPAGIPETILTGDNKHNKPLLGQMNNIVFEKKE